MMGKAHVYSNRQTISPYREATGVCLSFVIVSRVGSSTGALIILTGGLRHYFRSEFVLVGFEPVTVCLMLPRQDSVIKYRTVTALLSRPDY